VLLICVFLDLQAGRPHHSLRQDAGAEMKHALIQSPALRLRRAGSGYLIMPIAHHRADVVLKRTRFLTFPPPSWSLRWYRGLFR
jgi:hypothetical protein